jgi:alpha-L-arabinofuranosidase
VVTGSSWDPGERKFVIRCIDVVAVFVTAACAAQAQITIVKPIPQTATVDVYAAQFDSHPIPHTIFGTFLEPIGNSTYNGLWAEELENPSFEAGLWSPEHVASMLREAPELVRSSDLGVPLPWQPLNESQGNRYEIHEGDAANSWRSLQVFGVPPEQTGIKQKIYLPTHRTLDFSGSFYAKHLGGDDTITIALRIHDQADDLASQRIVVDSNDWKKYSFALHVPEGKLHRLDPADFVVALAGDERVQLDQFSLMPADAIDGLDPDAVAMARAMNTPLVRFGGNFTSSYHWKDGVGPRDKRVNMLNNSWGIPEYNTFGTDEFLAFCRLINAQPQIALNLGSGTPEEAADWVRYVDERWSQHSGLLWELGNELWGTWNLGYPTRDQLPARTAAYSRAVRAADPSARLIATGADPEVFHDWNAIQLTDPPGTFDDLSTHFVVGTGDVEMKDPTPDFIAEAAFALPVELARKLNDEQSQIDNTEGYKGRVHIAFTEWLWVNPRLGAPVFTNMGGAVVTGGFLNMLLRNSAIVPVSDMTGIMEFAGIWKKRSQVYATPAYYVFRMYAGADAIYSIPVQTNAGTYQVRRGVKRLPQIDDVPYLDVAATRNRAGDVLTLFCVNRSVSSDISTSIRLHDFAGTRKAEVSLVQASALTDQNDESDPTRVRNQDTVEDIPARGWIHVFPHASVTLITLRRSAKEQTSP